MRTAFFWAITQPVLVIPFPTFRDNLSVPSSGVKNTSPRAKIRFLTLERKVVPKRRQGIATTRCVIAQRKAILFYFGAGV